MSLISALNIGKSALAVHQAAIQVASNNIANAGNADYTRQVTGTTPMRDQELRPGVFTGTGVSLSAIQRQIDDALEGRLRTSISDSESAATRQQWLGRVESIFNELGDSDLSTQFSAFFANWSNLANKPQDSGLRQIVLQAGEALSSTFQDLRSQLTNMIGDLDNRMTSLVRDASALAGQVAHINEQIVAAEGGTGGSANALRDMRDATMKKLSELMDVRVQDTANGMVNVLVGSEPLVLGSYNRELLVNQQTAGDRTAATIVNGQDNGTMQVSSGTLGGLTGVRGEIQKVIDQLDALASSLIFDLNKVHSSGQGLEGFSLATAASSVADSSAALDSANAGLAFKPVNGSFVVHVTSKTTGTATSTLVQVDLDGMGAQTTLASLQADLDAIGGLSASIVAGKLQIRSDSPNLHISFSQDTSGALAALGINTFFTGSSALDIAVNKELVARPALLAAAQNGQATDNQTARAIAALEAQAMAGLGGKSIRTAYESIVNSVAITNATAKTNLEASLAVKETLGIQREGLSGVSLDEEAINLMRSQRSFQGAARVISAVDEMMRTLLQMI